jgi:hypothetical protein
MHWVLNRVTPLAALLAPTAVLGKVRLDELKLTEGAVPTPVIETDCGLPAALSTTEMLA